MQVKSFRGSRKVLCLLRCNNTELEMSYVTSCSTCLTTTVTLFFGALGLNLVEAFYERKFPLCYVLFAECG